REPGEFESHWEVLEALKATGFPVNPRSERCSDIEAVLDYARRLEAERDTLGYDADGVVVKVNNLEQQRRVGATSHNPRWALAFKLRARPGATRVAAMTITRGARAPARCPAPRTDPRRRGGRRPPPPPPPHPPRPRWSWPGSP